MNTRTALRTAIACVGLAMGAAFAQQSTPLVMTDTAPLPAEDRNSTGAIVLESSPIRAQRDRDFEGGTPKAERQQMGRGIVRATLREKAKSDLQKSREAEAIEFYQRGAAHGTPK